MKYFATLKNGNIEARLESNDKGEVANWISDLFIEHGVSYKNQLAKNKWAFGSVEITCNFKIM